MSALYRKRANTDFRGQILILDLIFALCSVLLYKAVNLLFRRITVQVCNNPVYNSVGVAIQCIILYVIIRCIIFCVIIQCILYSK